MEDTLQSIPGLLTDTVRCAQSKFLQKTQGLLDEKGHVIGLRRALLADSSATMIGAVFGTSSATSYVESIAGVKAGGRTGLTAVTVAVLFCIALFFAPLASAIQPYATGPALVFVGCVMAGGLAHVDWDDATSYVPAVITAVAMPLTYSIATGIGLGFITYVALKLGSGRSKDLNLGEGEGAVGCGADEAQPRVTAA